MSLAIVRSVPVTLSFLLSEAALLLLMNGSEAWRALLLVASVPAYVLTVYGAGLGLGLGWPWNTLSILALAASIDLALHQGRRGRGAVRDP